MQRLRLILRIFRPGQKSHSRDLMRSQIVLALSSAICNAASWSYQLRIFEIAKRRFAYQKRGGQDENDDD